MKLQTIICSTRPGRMGPAVAKWFHGQADAHPGFDAELIDIADFNLPMFDEPQIPRFRNYVHDHTKAWAASVASADAYVFVTPEYNGGTTPVLINAINYLYHEWGYKPGAFVSYGGGAGGVRAVHGTKLLLSAVKIMPIPESVTIPNVWTQVTPEVGFTANDAQLGAAKMTLDELAVWAKPLHDLRGTQAK